MRIFFIRASGAKGFPFSIPIEASSPSSSESTVSVGSSWTIRSSLEELGFTAGDAELQGREGRVQPASSARAEGASPSTRPASNACNPFHGQAARFIPCSSGIPIPPGGHRCRRSRPSSRITGSFASGSWVRVAARAQLVRRAAGWIRSMCGDRSSGGIRVRRRDRPAKRPGRHDRARSPRSFGTT